MSPCLTDSPPFARQFFQIESSAPRSHQSRAALPGQEEANVDFQARLGSALGEERPADVVDAAQRSVEHPPVMVRMKRQARMLGHPSSAKHSTEHISRMEGSSRV